MNAKLAFHPFPSFQDRVQTFDTLSTPGNVFLVLVPYILDILDKARDSFSTSSRAQQLVPCPAPRLSPWLAY